MNHVKTVVILCSALLLVSTSQIAGKESFWDKGKKLLGGADKEQMIGELGLEEIAAAFKEALQIGSESVVAKLGIEDGFNTDPEIHIPLPKALKKVKSVLARVGMADSVDELELKLNRAAEAAVPKARDLFVESIREMTFDDVKQIYDGPDNAATLYFREKMSPNLAAAMKPIVDASLSEVGAIQTFDEVMDKYGDIPFVPDVKADLSDHVIEGGMDGIFYYLAREEKAIRENPAKQTTQLLKKVFGR